MSSHHRSSSAPTTLYVRNIPDRIRYDELKRLFQKYGRVLDVTIPIDFYNGMTKGYCFVEYEFSKDAEQAQYKIDKQRLFGKDIEVEFARGQRKTPTEMKIRDKERKDIDYASSCKRSSRSRSRSDSRTRSQSRSEGRSLTKSFLYSRRHSTSPTKRIR